MFSNGDKNDDPEDRKTSDADTVMTLVRETMRIGAPVDTVWAVLANFGAVDAFSPHVTKSFILGGAPETGVGAERQCNLSDGRSHEKQWVTAWSDGASYSVEIFDGTMPIRDAFSRVSVEKTAAHHSQATIAIGYTSKLGILGQILDALLIKRRLSRVAADNLEGLRALVIEKKSLKAENQ